MQKILLILLLAGFSFSKAEWYKGQIFKINGETINCYLKYPKFNDSNIKYRLTKDGETTKIEGGEVKEITLTEDGKTLKYKPLYFASVKNNKGELRKLKKKYWFLEEYNKGDLSILSCYITYNDGKSMKAYVSYAFNWKEDDYAVDAAPIYGGLGITIGKGAYLRAVLKATFKDKCPKLVSDIESKTFKPKKLEEFVDYYEKNCISQ